MRLRCLFLRRWSITLAATAAVALAAGAALLLRADPTEVAVAAPSAIPSWPWAPRGDRVTDPVLLDQALRAWESTAGPVAKVRVLLAQTNPVLGVVVMLEGRAGSGLRVATLSGLRGQSMDGALGLRDDRAAGDLAAQPGIALLITTPEEHVDDSQVAVVLARPGATIQGTASSAFDAYRQPAGTTEFAINVVPADATAGNTATRIQIGASQAVLRMPAASTGPVPGRVGRARINYVPSRYALAPQGTVESQNVSTRLYVDRTGATIAVVEERGHGLTSAGLFDGSGAMSPANPHASAPMTALDSGARWGFGWTNASRSLGYSVIASGGDAQIVAYHVAQAIDTPY